MSDPVTNVQIEDVLSSIRRLVAEGDKAKQEKQREYGDASVSAPAEKFVLTPSLRISERAERDTSDPALSTEEPTSDEALLLSNEEFLVDEQTASLKDVFVGEPHAVAEAPDLSSLLGGQPAETEENIDLREIVAGTSSLDLDADADVDETASEFDEPAFVPEQESPRNSNDETSTRESLEATIAALEAAVTSGSEEFEPDGSEVKLTSTWQDTPAVDGEEGESALEDEALKFPEAENEYDSVLELGEPIEPKSSSVLHLGDYAVFTRSQSNRSDDGDAESEDEFENEASTLTEADDLSATDSSPDGYFSEVADVHEEEPHDLGRVFRVVPELPPEEHKQQTERSETGTHNALMRKPSTTQTEEDFGDELIGSTDLPVASDDDLDAMLPAADMLDEAALRQIVSEVLKGELEGQLGETITRNVRRLVRREINRVLAHQELE